LKIIKSIIFEHLITFIMDKKQLISFNFGGSVNIVDPEN